MDHFILNYQKNLVKKSYLFIVFQLCVAGYDATVIFGSIVDMRSIFTPFMFLSVWALIFSIAYRVVSSVEYLSVKSDVKANIEIE